MKKKKIIDKTIEYVKQRLSGEGSGHDWWHIYRVWNMAKKIAKIEGANMFIVEMAALLHDIADRKLNKGDEKAGLMKVQQFLSTCLEDKMAIDIILDIISSYSYTSYLKNIKIVLSKEGQVVQDADRLDAIGAIGIARTFNYGGHVGSPLYVPTIKPRKHISAKSYTKIPSPTINHFYEKLLLLKDLMNTKTAKLIAKKRHIFMEKYLKQFYLEWKKAE